MCGIVGFIGEVPEGKWAQTHQLLQALLLLSQERGMDATGFVARTAPFKNELAGDVVMAKQPLAAEDFLRKDSAWRSLKHRRCTSVLGHVRWATHGSPEDNANNHPIEGKSSLYLVHNGVLTDHRATAAAHGLDLRTDVDSELILRFVERAQHPATGLYTAFRRTRGSMAAVVYDGHRDALYMIRDENRPLWLLKMGRSWFFASTREILLGAFDAVFGGNTIPRVETLMPMAAGCVHVLTSSGRLIALPDGRKT